MKKTWVVLLGILLLSAAWMTGCAGQRAKDGDAVKVHYTLMLEDGNVYDSSVGREPLQVTLGEGALIQGFEEAVIGMRVGDTKTVALPPEKAYGPYRPELVEVVSRGWLPEGLEPAVGQELEATAQDGSPITVVITEVTETTVTVDANLPLAGRTLTFEIELVAIGENLAARDSAGQAGLSWLLLALALGVLAAGFAFFYLRGWRRLRRVRASPARRSERLLAEIARLDDDFEDGRIAKAAYRQARKQKKAQLVRLMQHSVKESGH
jgi:peptidylprolyl isomerase